jgi:hypothetical protein
MAIDGGQGQGEVSDSREEFGLFSRLWQAMIRN